MQTICYNLTFLFLHFPNRGLFLIHSLLPWSPVQETVGCGGCRFSLSGLLRRQSGFAGQRYIDWATTTPNSNAYRTKEVLKFIWPQMAIKPSGKRRQTNHLAKQSMQTIWQEPSNKPSCKALYANHLTRDVKQTILQSTRCKQSDKAHLIHEWLSIMSTFIPNKKNYSHFHIIFSNEMTYGRANKWRYSCSTNKFLLRQKNISREYFGELCLPRGF
jgi:hypothetical protein